MTPTPQRKPRTRLRTGLSRLTPPTGLRGLGGLRGLTGPQLFLLAGSFLIPLGSFAVLPFMSVLLHERLGMELGTVGVVLAVASFMQFSGGIVGAAIAERIGLQSTMVLALVIRTTGFAGFLPGLGHAGAAVTALFLVSSGAALYLPANKAYLVHRVEEEQRPLLLSASSSALNAGIALGPIAAAPFVLSASAELFATVTVLFAAITVGHVLLPAEIPDHEPSGPEEEAATEQPPPRRAGRAKAFAGLPVLPFAITVLSVYVFMFFQHYLAVYAVPRTSTVFYGLVLALYALLLVVAQPLLSAWIARMPYNRALGLGFTALSSGMITLAAGHPAAILGGALLICLGEIILFLKNDLEALARSPRTPAVVFGRQRLAAGIGAFASGIAGGEGYKLAEQSGHPGLFWATVAVQCALLPPLLIRALRRRRRTSAELLL
ncbi:MFS transporter [Streptomyces spongiae]|uniref:MFS transporter n=1 Tax=Streptomyces spongiae TaxID=565072 RepID=A0A5N8XSP6_9ACTN|nr:MFS transporter [Streptomyces spongiae]MPY61635.1 MFS transporter [Streptomyces spongiae]